MKRISRILLVAFTVAMLAMMAFPLLAQDDDADAAETTSEIALVNSENLVAEISPMTYDITAQILTLGFSVMLAALFYFVLTVRSVAPRYRISSVLSVVVMVSAFLILYAQAQAWEDSFVYNTAAGVYTVAPGAVAFSNGYRYLNWLIDVPMLLFQILFVVEITRERRASLRNQFFFSGTGMIVTGYIGQFYEAQASLTAFYIWGFISTLFFAHVLYLIYQIIQDAKGNLSERAGGVMGAIWWLFFFSWMLYPGGYLMPVLLGETVANGGRALTEAGIVGRQLTYTVADVSSKVIYGVMLTYVAQIRSEEEGFVGEFTADAPATAATD